MDKLEQSFLEQALDHRSVMFVQLPGVNLD